MDTLQKLFEKEISSSLTFSKIGSILLKHRLQDYGIEIISDELTRIEKKLEEYDSGSISFSIDIDETKFREVMEEKGEPLKIDLSDEKSDSHLKDILNEYYQNIGDFIPAIINEITPKLYSILKKNIPSLIRSRRRASKKFRRKHMRQWRRPLELLEVLLDISLEAGDNFNNVFRQDASENENFVFEVLTRSHARACQICSEILALLKSGHADGAIARWRSLHEISVVCTFIKEHGNELAECYLLHDHIESYKAALQFNEFSSALGYDPIPDDQINSLKDIRDELCRRFGKAYKNQYGWAATVMPNDYLNFRDIEEAVNLDHLRPFYKLASHNVHANPKGVYFRMGLYPNSHNILLAGPSNTGLADPIQNTAISMSQISTCLLTLEPNIDRLLTCNILLQLEREIGTLAVETQKGLESQVT